MLNATGVVGSTGIELNGKQLKVGGDSTLPCRAVYVRR